MSFLRRTFLLASLLVLSTVSARASTAQVGAVKAPHLEAELVAEDLSIQPGQPTQLAIRMKPEPGWHIYWKNPGDSGLPPRAEWELPAGFRASELLFPVPERIQYKTLVNFGYHEETLFLTRIETPKNLQPGTEATFTAKVKYLVCQEECLPGKATVHAILPVKATPPSKNPDWSKPVAEARSKLPETLPPGDSRVTAIYWKSAQGASEFLRLNVNEPGKLEFFPLAEGPVEPSSPQRAQSSASGSHLTLNKKADPKAGDRVRGVLVVGDKAYDLDLPLKEERPADAAASEAAPGPQAGAEPLTASLLLVMTGLAILGGLILNLMPCVFPVLSIKVLSFVQQGGEEQSVVRKHGIYFTFGVLVCFWVLTAVLAILKVSGAEMGWGFQLQSPFFVSMLAFLFFFMGLNLLGAFEVGTRLIGVGAGLTQKTGYAGSFFTGMLTTVAATPCSAPFMSTAVGFALAQPLWAQTLIMTALGLGLSLPYLLFSFSPALIRFLPKPGRWMETLKQALSFPLFATVLWLLWILSVQTSAEGVIRVLAGFLLGYSLIWFWNRVSARKKPGIVAMLFCVILGFGSLKFGILDLKKLTPEARATAKSAEEKSSWIPYSPETVAKYRSEKRPVFIDFGAEWCVTCKVNERLVLRSARVEQAFKDTGTVLIYADWTNNDPVITQALAEQGRSSVPLYLLYRPGQEKPVVLPQILTAEAVIQALK